jgi:hypothetical protein
MSHKPRRVLPSWVIVALGALGTGAAVIWASGLRDDQGDALIDGDVAKILIALLGAVGTLIGLLVKRTGAVEHQVTNNSGSTMKDSTDRTEAKVTTLTTTVERLAGTVAHLERAHRQTTSDVAELREDVQQSRRESADNFGGLRKDLGRLTDVITKKGS